MVVPLMPPRGLFHVHEAVRPFAATFAAFDKPSSLSQRTAPMTAASQRRYVANMLGDLEPRDGAYPWPGDWCPPWLEG